MRIITILVVWLFWAGRIGAEVTCTIAAASDLVSVMMPLQTAFTSEYPRVRLKVVFGSSGNIFAQIQLGAPFDLFLSADTNYPATLIHHGNAESNSFTRYAIGHLALWSSNSKIAVSTNLHEILRNPAIHRIAIANPLHAPYGKAAKSTLEHLGLWHDVQNKIVLAENVAQAFQFTQSGHAQLALLPLSLVRGESNRVSSYIPIPSDWHPPITQSGVITSHGATNASARQFLKFLTNSTAQNIFKHHGFSTTN